MEFNPVFLTGLRAVLAVLLNEQVTALMQLASVAVMACAAGARKFAS